MVVGLKNPDGQFVGAKNLRCDGLPEASEDQVTHWLELGSEERVVTEITGILGAKRVAQVICRMAIELIRLSAIGKQQ